MKNADIRPLFNKVVPLKEIGTGLIILVFPNVPCKKGCHLVWTTDRDFITLPRLEIEASTKKTSMTSKQTLATVEAYHVDHQGWVLVLYPSIPSALATRYVTTKDVEVLHEVYYIAKDVRGVPHPKYRGEFGIRMDALARTIATIEMLVK